MPFELTYRKCKIIEFGFIDFSLWIITITHDIEGWADVAGLVALKPYIWSANVFEYKIDCFLVMNNFITWRLSQKNAVEIVMTVNVQAKQDKPI